MRATVFEAVDVFDGHSAELLQQQHVLVEGERIRQLSDRPIEHPDAERISGQGATLIPGLIDAHYHALASDVSMRVVERQTPYHIAQFARCYLQRSLQRGFTTIRDAGGADWGLAQAIKEGLMSGEIGEIRPGARADLLLVEGNPLQDLQCLQEEGRFLLSIMKQGRLMKHKTR